MEKLVKKGKFTQQQIDEFKERIEVAEFKQIQKDSDLIIEAIIENLDAKISLFKNLDALCNPNTLFASNTSSIPITKICSELNRNRRSQFLGIHFFNPAPIMKLVEIICAKDTDKTVANELASWFKNKGKVPAICKDRPGFIVNRVARSFYGEPLRIAEKFDEKRLREIDSVLKNVGGFRMGPFELMDLIGIDVNYDVTNSVWEAFDKSPRFAPHPLQKQMVDENRNGKKAGRGFYSYE